MKRKMRTIIVLSSIFLIVSITNYIGEPVDADENDYIFVLTPVEAEDTSQKIPNCELSIKDRSTPTNIETYELETSGAYQGSFVIDTSDINWYTPGILVTVELDADTQNRIMEPITKVMQKRQGVQDYQESKVCASLASNDGDYYGGQIFVNDEFYKQSPDETEMFVEKSLGTVTWGDSGDFEDKIRIRVQYAAHLDISQLNDNGAEPFYGPDDYTLRFYFTASMTWTVGTHTPVNLNSGYIYRNISTKNGWEGDVHVDPVMAFEFDQTDTELTGTCRLDLAWYVVVAFTDTTYQYYQDNNGDQVNFLINGE